MLVLIDKRTLTPKNDGKRSFSYEMKASNVIHPNEENEFMAPNHEKKRDCFYTN